MVRIISEQQKQESAKIIKQLISENKIVRPSQGAKEFFLEKAINSLRVSRRLFEISEDPEDPLEGYMWVINAAYYSMFFAATALLAHFNHKIDICLGIHKNTFHALNYYFLIDDNKLQKHFIEEYKQMYEDAEQLLQISEKKSDDLVKTFDLERDKRVEFTYDLGAMAKKNKAATSLKRAEQFLTEIRKMAGK